MSGTIAIMGGFGGGNLGDELIGLAEAGFLKANGQEPLLYSFSPTVSQGIQPESSWLDYRDFPDHFQRLRNLARRYSIQNRQLLPDLVIIGAGGLLYDTPLTHLIGWHSRTLRLRRKRVPYALFANSLRRPRSGLGRYLLRDVLQHAFSVSLRDQLSLGIARELCPRDDYRLTRDPVLTLGEILQPATFVPAQKGMIAVAPRPWGPSGENGGLSFWKGLLKGLMEQGLEPVLVAFDPRMDVEFCGQLRASLGLAEVRTWDPSSQGLAGAGAVFDGCEMVFGMRFHALILALLLEKPMLAFSYDEKVTGLMSDLGLSSLCQELNGDVSAALDFVQRGMRYLEGRESEILAGMRDYVRESRRLTTEDFTGIIGSYPYREENKI
jgi:polysaccharide pyruvyl transferase WcaK-like protein